MNTGRGAAIEAESLYRFFHSGPDEILALRGVSLTVQAGETVAVTGPSGSGKSTLMACLAGLDEPDGGMVRIDGEQLSRRSEEGRARLRGQRIGLLFQQANLWDHLTVAANLSTAQRLGNGADAARAVELLGDLRLAHRSNAYPSELSGGETARAGLAVALANDPAVILADEPTGELDSLTGDRVVDLLMDRARDGAAVLIVTHTERIAERVDRRIRLRDGTVEA